MFLSDKKTIEERICRTLLEGRELYRSYPLLFSRTLMIIGMIENDSRRGKESSKRIRRNSANLSCRTGNSAGSHQTGRETLIPQVTSVIRNNSQNIENTSCSY